MLIFTIAYLYSNGILSDLHHPLRWHTPYCSYSFHTHSDSRQVFLTICSSYLMLTIGWLDTSIIPMHSDWMILYLVITWTLTYLVSWLTTYCVYKSLSYTIEHQSWAGLSSQQLTARQSDNLKISALKTLIPFLVIIRDLGPLSTAQLVADKAQPKPNSSPQVGWAQAQTGRARVGFGPRTSLPQWWCWRTCQVESRG